MTTMINKIDFEAYKGQVTLMYNDTDISTDYFNGYTTSQRNAVKVLKESGLPKIEGTVTNDYDPKNVEKGMKAFRRISKATGIEIVFKPPVDRPKHCPDCGPIGYMDRMGDRDQTTAAFRCVRCDHVETRDIPETVTIKGAV